MNKMREKLIELDCAIGGVSDIALKLEAENRQLKARSVKSPNHITQVNENQFLISHPAFPSHFWNGYEMIKLSVSEVTDEGFKSGVVFTEMEVET